MVLKQPGVLVEIPLFSVSGRSDGPHKYHVQSVSRVIVGRWTVVLAALVLTTIFNMPEPKGIARPLVLSKSRDSS
jgi:hypothetical protein